MKKKVMPIILVLAIAFGVIAFKPSLAWLSSSFNKSQKVDIGALSYTFDDTVSLNASYTDGSSNTFATPGENLLYVGTEPGTLKIFNLSTITTNLRIRIDYTYYNTDLLPLPGFVTIPYGEKPALTDDFDVKDYTGELLGVSSKWSYDAGYWNYVADPLAGAGKTDDIIAYIEPTTLEGETTLTPPVGDEIELISSVGYSSLLGNNSPYKDKPVTVKLTVQVKQADYVDWSTIATIIG